MSYTLCLRVGNGVHVSDYAKNLRRQELDCINWLKLHFERRSWAIHKFLSGSTTLKMGTHLESNEYFGFPSSSKNQVIVQVKADWRLTIRVVAKEPRISFGLWQGTDCGMRDVSFHPVAADSREKGSPPIWSLWFAWMCRRTLIYKHCNRWWNVDVWLWSQN